MALLRLLAFALLAVVLTPGLALAQAAPAELVVRVVDERGQPIRDARVFVIGPDSANALTTAEGSITFVDVTPGLYRLRVLKEGYDGFTLDEVETLSGRRKNVTVTLVRTSGLKVIGEVRVRSRAVVGSDDVDADSPIRRITETLGDALSSIAGASVISNNQGNTLTVSLRNASNTTASIGGAPIGGAGAATLQAVAADLATGVRANPDTTLTSSAGNVNFRTLEPTKIWQQQLSASYGTYEHTALQASFTGSVGKTGFALQHGIRGGDSPITNLAFLDTSGAAYLHDGAFSRIGSLVKFRYPVGSHFTLTAQQLDARTTNSVSCTAFATVVPCGYGPDGILAAHSISRSLLAQGQVGNVTFYTGISSNTYRSDDNEQRRAFGGLATPKSSSYDDSYFAVFNTSTIAIRRHTVGLNIVSSSSHGLATVNGAFGGTFPVRLRYGAVVGFDTYKFSDRWDATVGYGSNAMLAGSVQAADLAVELTPSRSERITVSAGTYGGGSFFSSPGLLADPSTGRYNCTDGSLIVTGANDDAVPGRSLNVSAGYSRRGKAGSLQASLYRRVDHGGTIYGLVPLSAIAPTSLPPGYVSTVFADWHNPYICGAGAPDPAHAFVNKQVNGLDLKSEGLSASGQRSLGRNALVQGSYATDASTLLRPNPRVASRSRIRRQRDVDVRKQSVQFALRHPRVGGRLLDGAARPRDLLRKQHLQYAQRAIRDARLRAARSGQRRRNAPPDPDAAAAALVYRAVHRSLRTATLTS